MKSVARSIRQSPNRRLRILKKSIMDFVDLQSEMAAGCVPFWSTGSAASPAIKEFSPTIVFDAACENGQSVGPAFVRCHLFLVIPKNGPHPFPGY